ncbi:MAG TPA: helix-turn-helix domain-containing protein [Chloroflexia bacterium]|nr:helix-turn-helix domain-containing protein [Chloroflexia bacterium]
MLAWNSDLAVQPGPPATLWPVPGPAGAPVIAGAWPGAALLQQYREAAGLSRAQLAARARICRSTVADLENGQHRNPYYRTLAALANVLHVDLTGLILGEAPAGPWTGRPHDLCWAGAQVVSTCRAAQGLTLKELQARSGLSRDLLRAIERRPMSISYSTLIQLAAALGITTRQLITGQVPARLDAVLAAGHPVAEAEVWTVAEATARTGMSADQVYKLIARQQIAARWRGKTRVVVASELHAWNVRHGCDGRGRRPAVAA